MNQVAQKSIGRLNDWHDMNKIMFKMANKCNTYFLLEVLVYISKLQICLYVISEKIEGSQQLDSGANQWKEWIHVHAVLACRVYRDQQGKKLSIKVPC